jgi:hypothetical protein
MSTYDGDFQISAPRTQDRDAFAERDQRIVSVFDSEARAARMSMMMESSLFPPPLQVRNRHSVWVGAKNAQRETWLAPVAHHDVKDRVWSGEFDVERRPSWQSRCSSRLSGSLDLAHIDLTLDEKSEPFMVRWDQDDAENPLNFTAGTKWFNAMMLAFACFMVSIASSGFSQGTRGCVVQLLSTSLLTRL